MLRFFANHLFHLVQSYGNAKQIPLRKYATVGKQLLSLFLFFHTLGGYLHIGKACHVDHKLHDLGIHRAFAHVLYEGLVELHGIDWVSLNIAQGRVSSAEIVEGDLYTEAANLFEELSDPLGILQEDAFRNL